MDLFLVIAGGLFSLGGVLLGGLLTPLTQLFIERKREQRAADRAKLLVAGELLNAQLILSIASENKRWPLMEDINSFLPTSAWQENRSSLAGNIHKDLWNELVMAYTLLENDRSRIVNAKRLPPDYPPLSAEVVEGIKDDSNRLGYLRNKLGGGSVILDVRNEVDRLNDNFKGWLDGLSDDDLRKDAMLAKAMQVAKDLGKLNQSLGDNGAWSAEINDYLKRRLK